MTDEEMLIVECSVDASERLTEALSELDVDVRRAKIERFEGLVSDGMTVMALFGATMLPGVLARLKAFMIGEHTPLIVKYNGMELINPTPEQLESLLRHIATSTGPSDPQSLSDLFVTLFSVDELRRFIRGFAAALENDLPWDKPAAYLTSELTEVLRRRGYVDATLFAALRQARPRRTSEIDAVRSRILT